MVSVNYNFLGKSGLKVSNICLGTATFGKKSKILVGQSDEETSFAILDRFTELGGNFIDTANIYSMGQSEEFIGNWLTKRGQRDDLVVATKVLLPMGSQCKEYHSLGRKQVMQSIDESLRRLQTNYVDIFQYHCRDQGGRFEELVRTFDDLVRIGKVRYLGASNFCGWQLQKLVDTCDKLGLNPFTSLQNQYSLLCRKVEYEVIDVCRNEGLGFLPWSPLKGGWLSGKFHRGMREPTPGSRIEHATKTRVNLQIMPTFAEQANESTWTITDALEIVSKECDKSMAQVSLRWLLQKDTVDSVIIGARTLAQLEDNMGAGSDWKLSPEQMKLLNDASDPGKPYPYNMAHASNIGRG